MQLPTLLFSAALLMGSVIAVGQQAPLPAAVSSESGTLELFVRSSLDGRGIAGTVLLERHPDAKETVTADEALRLEPTTLNLSQAGGRFNLATGVWSIAATAPGHRSLDTWTVIEPSATQFLSLWLDPEERSPRATLPGASPGDGIQLVGHIIDAATGLPVSDANIEVVGYGQQTRSDENGAFDLTVGTQPRPNPETVDLNISNPEYGPLIVHAVPLIAGRTELALELRPGVLKQSLDLSHKNIGARFERLAALTDLCGFPPQGTKPQRQSQAAPGVLSALSWSAPPLSIRVGYQSDGGICCTGSCSQTQVFTLEQYVRRGLNDEWIASWGSDSLRAGAIAYRSYGAWHALNPNNGSYDICSSACCQVNDADTHSATDQAAQITSGFMLEHSDSIFRSEYSAENNSWDDDGDGLTCSNADLSCGDGSVGSPATGWPCLGDVVAAGFGCFGHGRGMSQWGSSRWDAWHQKSWRFIVDHYYNNSGSAAGLRGAFVTSPIELVNISSDQSSYYSGEVMKLQALAHNHAEDLHDLVLFGASLRNASGSPVIDDPNGDATVVLPAIPTVTEVTRDFSLPQDLAAGSYDLLVGLWLDVDLDGAITGEDLILQSMVASGSIQVARGDNVLLLDRFEEANTDRWSTVVSD